MTELHSLPHHTEPDEPADSWTPILLTALPDKPPVQPTLGGVGLVYPGKRHVFSGPQESAKTLAAYAIAIQVVRGGGTTIIIDFEMGAWDARNRLQELGATHADLQNLLYVEPHEPATDQRIHALAALHPQLVVIDAAAGAYDLQGLDDNKRGDVERIARLYIRRFWQAGIATIMLDHVVKNTEGRGKYAIGSERKVGGADVHLGFETITPISRGSSGLYKVVTHKDRGGYLQRGRLADLHLHSDPETHRITWEFRAADHDPEGRAQLPTELMQRVSHYLEEQAPEPVTRNQIVLNVRGNAEFVRRAIDHLVQLRFVEESAGSNRSRLYQIIRPFIRSEWESKEESQVRPGSSQVRPDELWSGSSSSSPPYGGRDDPRTTETHQVRPTDDDEEVRALLAHYDLLEPPARPSTWIDDLEPPSPDDDLPI